MRLQNWLKLMGDANARRRSAPGSNWTPAPADPVKDLENIARARQERQASIARQAHRGDLVGAGERYLATRHR